MSSLQSMFPPASARGGMVEWQPGAAGATPVTPRNGARDRVYFPFAVAVPASASISQSRKAGSVPASPSRAGTGEPGAPGEDVHPQVSGVSETTSTASMSPGAAPRTATGRFRQCPRRSPSNIFGLRMSPGNSCRSR
jgi:hypothetical protein